MIPASMLENLMENDIKLIMQPYDRILNLNFIFLP